MNSVNYKKNCSIKLKDILKTNIEIQVWVSMLLNRLWKSKNIYTSKLKEQQKDKIRIESTHDNNDNIY